MSFNPNPSIEEGNLRKTTTSNDIVESLLQDILKQLKIMNMQLVEITEQEIDISEVN